MRIRSFDITAVRSQNNHFKYVFKCVLMFLSEEQKCVKSLIIRVIQISLVVLFV